MISVQNLVTEEWFEVDDNVQVGEIIKDPNSGDLFEVIEIIDNQGKKVVKVESVNIDEDWGQ